MASPSIPNLMCFQHCVKNVNVFCFVLPALCPMCGEDLSTADLRIPPFRCGLEWKVWNWKHWPFTMYFRVALPFSTASNNPHHVVLKPTNGNFLRLLHPSFCVDDPDLDMENLGLKFGFQMVYVAKKSSSIDDT